MSELLNKWLTPVPDSLKSRSESNSASLVGNIIDFPEHDFVWENLRAYSIVIFGIEYANANEQLNNVREAFYSLYLHREHLKIIDLGNIFVEQGSAEDAQKIEYVTQMALKHNTFVIAFGSSPVYLNNCYNAVKANDNSVSVSYISHSATVGSAGGELSSKNHLAHLLEERNDKLFGLNIIAYQLYQTDAESLKLLNDSYCQTMRLGALRNDFKQVEPILRDTDLLAFNMSAVRSCDAPASHFRSPNGLYAEEICQLARYSGIADRLKVAGIFGFDFENDSNTITAQLVAQIIWHLVDGYSDRKNDNPLKNVNGIKKYIVDMGAPHQQLVFYYSTLSERWWMEVPGKASANSLLIACSNDDYRTACSHEVPLRWVWFHQKMLSKNG